MPTGWVVTGPKCPKCGSGDSHPVYEDFWSEDGAYHVKLVCLRCEHRWWS